MKLKNFALMVKDAFRYEKKFSEKLNTRFYLEYPSAWLRKLPDFIFLGGEKCGSTCFSKTLRRHPELHESFKKEPHYFDWDDRFDYGQFWYRCWFPLKLKLWLKGAKLGKEVLAYESTAHYLFSVKAPPRIKRLLPDVKFIVLLRNPVKRAYSDYHFRVAPDSKGSGFKLSFKEVIQQELDWLSGSDTLNTIFDFVSESGDSFRDRELICFRQGLYYFQLLHWFDYFPRDQFLIIKSERFFEEPLEVFNEVSDFLDVSRPKFSLEELPRYNPGSYPSMAPETKNWLKNLYRPFNEKLYGLLGRDFKWEKEI